MTQTWAPKPGTVAGRVIDYLQTLPRGMELSSSALAEACGVPIGSVTPCLQPALDAGAVRARQRGGHARSPIFWSLVDHNTATPAQDDGKPTQRTIPARGAPPLPISPPLFSPLPEGLRRTPVVHAVTREASSLADASQKPNVDGPRSSTAPANADRDGAHATRATDAAGPAGIRIALWSDGTLQIQRAATDLVVFSADETRVLVRYLDHIVVPCDETAAAP